MKVVISGEQISFFERFGYVELESFFTETTVSQLKTIILKTKLTHNLSIDSLEAKKILLSPIGQAVHSFIRMSPIRYASDFLLSSPQNLNSIPEHLFSISPIVAVLIIALDSNEEVRHKISPSIVTELPSKAGNALFVSPKTLLQCKVPQHTNYLFLGCTSGKPIYILQPTDPHTHSFKTYGYVFGDNLKDPTHPVIFSR